MTDRREDGQHPSSRPVTGAARFERPLPQELASALGASPDARARFEQLPPSHRREYVHWVADARRADTRERRAAQAIMRLLEQVMRPPEAGDDTEQ